MLLTFIFDIAEDNESGDIGGRIANLFKSNLDILAK